MNIKKQPYSLQFYFFSTITICIFLILQACDYANKPIYKIDKLDTEKEIILNKWEIFTPTFIDSTKHHHYLFQNRKHPNVNKDSLTYETIQIGNHYIDTVFYPYQRITENYTNQSGLIYLKGRPSNTLAYASCTINSSCDQDIVLVGRSDDGLIVNLNNSIISKQHRKRSFANSMDYIHAKLKKGENHLVLKIFRAKNSPKEKNRDKWNALCNFMSADRYNSHYLKSNRDYLESSVIPLNIPLKLRTVFSPSNPIKKAIIYNPISKKEELCVNITKTSDSIYLKKLSRGSYQVKLLTDKDTLVQDFYYGDILTTMEQSINKINKEFKTKKNTLVYLNYIDPIIRRCNLLMKHYNKTRGSYIETSSDGINYNRIFTGINMASREVILDTPKKFIKISTLFKTNTAISELLFYTRDKNKKLKRIHPKNTNSWGLYKYISDNNNETRWSPPNYGGTTFLTFEFQENLKPTEIHAITRNDIHERGFQRKLVYLYSELNTILNTKNYDTINLIKNSPGTHIRGYNSSVDSSTQYYVVQAPENEKTLKDPLPLIVSIPVAMRNKMHFLKGIVVAQLNNLENTQYLINKSDFIRVVPSARTFSLSSTPICEADVFDAIEAVKKEYNIDSDRIYLSGICGGTTLALNMANHYPSKFAAINIDEASLSKYWEKESPSTIYPENLSNIPMRFINEEKSTHTPIQIAQYFIHRAKEKEVEIEHIIHKDATKELKSALKNWGLMFNFFKGKSISKPKNIHFSTSYYRYNKSYWLSIFTKKSGTKASVQASVKDNKFKIKTINAKEIKIYPFESTLNFEKPIQIEINGSIKEFNPPFSKEIVIELTKNNSSKIQKNEYTEGPILRAFENNFILVNGTLGKKEVLQFSDSLVKSFEEKWKKDYFVLPTIKNDIDISKDDIKNANLILLGNQNTNKLFKKIYEQLPIKIESNSIELFQKTFRGNSLGFSIILPNPLNSKKYILLIGGNDLSKINFRDKNFAETGYNDYEIFNFRRSKNAVFKGNFNQFWQLK